jgi:hypothetical protein
MQWAMEAARNSLQGGATGTSLVGTRPTEAELQLSIQKRSLLKYKSEAVLRGCISLLLTCPTVSVAILARRRGADSCDAMLRSPFTSSLPVNKSRFLPSFYSASSFE